MIKWRIEKSDKERLKNSKRKRGKETFNTSFGHFFPISLLIQDSRHAPKTVNCIIIYIFYYWFWITCCSLVILIVIAALYSLFFFTFLYSNSFLFFSFSACAIHSIIVVSYLKYFKRISFHIWYLNHNGTKRKNSSICHANSILIDGIWMECNEKPRSLIIPCAQDRQPQETIIISVIRQNVQEMSIQSK